MSNRNCDVLIIGAGPAGLMCALSIDPNKRVLLVEKPSKNFELGKRILVSGNGRANFFHENLTASNNTVNPYLREYEKEFLSLLKEDYGFPYVVEHGLYYPYFNRAESLRNALVSHLKDNVEVLKGLALKVGNENQLSMLNENGQIDKISFDSLVIATGGKSYDRDNYSYELLDSLKVKYKPFLPALCPVKVVEKIPDCLVNQRLKGKVSLICDGREVYCEFGEVLFKKDGLSGICIMNSTIAIHDEMRKGKKNFRFEIDYRYVKDQATGEITELEFASLDSYPTFLKEYIKKSGNKDKLIFRFADFYSFKESQISYGGVLLSELNLEDFSLKQRKNIHIIGETLDDNYICGGYNMGHALLEGYMVGKKL